MKGWAGGQAVLRKAESGGGEDRAERRAGQGGEAETDGRPRPTGLALRLGDRGGSEGSRTEALSAFRWGEAGREGTERLGG